MSPFKIKMPEESTILNETSFVDNFNECPKFGSFECTLRKSLYEIVN